MRDMVLHNIQVSLNCPHCATPMTLIGIDDAAGEWGTAICECWHCPKCDTYTDGDCIGDLGYIADEWDDFEIDEA